jgi:hypothetical protein
VLHKCVNPACRAQFLYLRQGRLFEVEIRYLDSPWGDGQDKLGNGKAHVERCWLCDQCAACIALRFDPRQGLIILSSLGDSEDVGTAGILQSSEQETSQIPRVLIRPLDLDLTALARRKAASKVDERRSEIA